MLDSLFKKRSSVLGIDISSTSVKLLELERMGNGYGVKSYGVVPLTPGTIIEKNIKDVDAVADAIRLAVSRSNSHAKLAAAAVASSSVITKIIQMDANLSDDEMETHIHLDADRLIPYPLDEVSIDFTVIGPAGDDSDQVDVLLAASRQENVDSRVSAIETAGLTTQVMDVESYAMERAFTHIAPTETESETVAIMDIGATMTTLHVIHHNEIVYTRDEVFGGKQLTTAIQEQYGLSYAQAGLAKKQGGLPEDYNSTILAPFKDGVVQQLSRSLQFFYSSTEHHSIQRIVLAGGTASIPGLGELVESQLQVPTMTANPFEALTIAPQVNTEALISDAPALMISYGLALRGLH